MKKAYITMFNRSLGDMPAEIVSLIAQHFSQPGQVEALCNADSHFDAFRQDRNFVGTYKAHAQQVQQSLHNQVAVAGDPRYVSATIQSNIDRKDGLGKLRLLVADQTVSDATRRVIRIGLGARSDASNADIDALRQDRDTSGNLTSETRALRCQAAAALLRRPDAPFEDVTAAQNLYSQINYRTANTTAGRILAPALAERAIRENEHDVIAGLRTARDKTTGSAAERVAIAGALMDVSEKDYDVARTMCATQRIPAEARTELAAQFADRGVLEPARQCRDNPGYSSNDKCKAATRILSAPGATLDDHSNAVALLNTPAIRSDASITAYNQLAIRTAFSNGATHNDRTRLEAIAEATATNLTTPLRQSSLAEIYAGMVIAGHDAPATRRTVRQFVDTHKSSASATLSALLLGDKHNDDVAHDLARSETLGDVKAVSAVVLQEVAGCHRGARRQAALRLAAPYPGAYPAPGPSREQSSHRLAGSSRTGR